MVGLQLTLSNGAGSFQATKWDYVGSIGTWAGTREPCRCAASRSGVFYACGDPRVVFADVPLSPIGVGGTVTATGLVDVTVQGARG